MGWQPERSSRRSPLRSGPFPTCPRGSEVTESGSDVAYFQPRSRSRVAQRRSGTAEDLKSCGAILCMEAAAFVRLPTASVPLNTRAPLVRDLTSVPAARPTMGWHGQAKQPMLQSALSVLAVVTDAQGALPWTDAATRVWAAAVWPRSMWSGSSAQLASKLVWWPPRHGGVAVPG